MINFVGVDVETTGLQESDAIIELGMVAFDNKLNIVDVFSHLVVDDVTWGKINTMNDHCVQMHTDNGLLADLDAAWSGDNPDQYSPDNVELAAVKWMESLGLGTNGAELLPMLGSSMKLDRDMLEKQMPILYNKIHYRSVDGTSFNQWVQRGLGHQWDDMRDHIDETVQRKFGTEPLVMNYPEHRVVRDVAYSAGSIIAMHNRIVEHGHVF